MSLLRAAAASALLALITTACAPGANGEPGDAATGLPEPQLAVAVASFDLAVGEDQRLMAGLFDPERRILAFGEVGFELGFLGEEPAGTAEVTERTTARFLPVPGMEPEGEHPTPRFLTDQPGNGVYRATVDLDRPGYWGLQVTAELEDGSVITGRTVFPVLEAPLVPAVGDEAPKTQNHTLADVEAGRAEPVALDSRAQDPDTPIPDPHLHQHTIAEAIDAGHPVVAVFSTPVYCQSRFCGPLVSVIAELAQRYEDRAEFVMVEVWESFEEQQLNDAAAEWIQTELGGNEPWVFLVGADGTIQARWDNVLDVAELEAELEALPATSPLS